MTAMRRKAGTCAVFVLPVALWLAAQVAPVSCGGAAGGNVNANAAAAKTAARGGGSEVEQGGNKKSVEPGRWGGARVRLEVGERGDASVEFDCAHGTIEKLAPDSGGDFSARGLFVKERGGPVRAEGGEEGEPARYSGKVTGKTMTLRVVLEGSGEEVGSYTLTHGKGTRLTKCL
jgi:hypothetical protein